MASRRKTRKMKRESSRTTAGAVEPESDMSAPIHPEAATRLRLIKLVHTIAWAFFAGCILALPIAAWRGHFLAAIVLIAVILVEVAILFANRFRCPLTDIAARYTDERHDNFDIYLPAWLARYNKQIFGTLYVAGILFTLGMWSRA